jgi:Ca-activated chloride channel family protein
MKFAEPFWLVVGLVILLALLWLYRRFDIRQRAALAEFASSHLLANLTASFSPTRRRIKRLLFAGAIAFIFIALARPQLGYHWEEQKQRGIDILFAIDTSKSMLTQDVTPDRLTRAKLAIADLVNKLDGDRVGLIAFAGDAFLQAPLSLDYNAFEESLDAVDTSTIPRGGTDISSAIQEAQVALGPETKNRKILVLLTDGEDLDGNSIDAARSAAGDGLVIYTIGVGSPAGGLIPVPGANGGTDFVKDASGQFVKSRLDENTLKQIAQVTGGLYEPLGQQGQGLQAIYDQALAKLPKQDLSSRSQRVYNERFQWPLAAGLICLFASMLIGTRRRDRKSPLRAQKASRTAPAMAAVFALMAIASTLKASPQSAEQAYNKGDFSTAEKQYEQATQERPDAAPLQFNLGAAAYKTGQYDTALPAFQKALDTDQVGVQQQAYYDIGNTQYRVGQKTEKSSPQDTIKAWQSAVQSYDAALKLKSDDADAKYNRDFVQKKLDELQKQQKQNQQDQQKQDQKKDQQDQQNQQQSGSQQNQQNNQANQQNQKQSGSQNQAQNGNPQNQNGQQGQQKNQSGQQQQQTAGNQGQQPPANNQGQQQQNNANQNSQTAQNGEKPAGPRGATIPDKDTSKPPQPGNDAAQADKPGEMSAQEAKDLLNSLKGSEHVLPVAADARNTANHSPDDQPVKDW